MIVKIFFLSFSLFLIFTSEVLAEKVKVGDFNFPEIGIKVKGVSFTPDASKFFFFRLDLEVDTAKRKLSTLRNFLDNLPSGNVTFKNLLIEKQKESWKAKAEEFSFSSKKGQYSFSLFNAEGRISKGKIVVTSPKALITLRAYKELSFEPLKLKATDVQVTISTDKKISFLIKQLKLRKVGKIYFFVEGKKEVIKIPQLKAEGIRFTLPDETIPVIKNLSVILRKGDGKLNLKASLNPSFADVVFKLNVSKFALGSFFIKSLLLEKLSGEKLFIKGDVITSKFRFLVDRAKLIRKEREIYVEGNILKVRRKIWKTPSSFSQLFTFVKKLSSLSKGINKDWHISFNKLEYDKFPQISPFEAYFFPSLNTFYVAGESCYFRFSLRGNLDLQNDSLFLTAKGETVSAPFSKLVACFFKELPVYVDGNITFMFSFETRGKTFKKIQDNLRLWCSGEIKNGKIAKVSNLDNKLGLLADLLFYARTGIDVKDTLPFSVVEFSLEGNLKEQRVKKLFFLSPVGLKLLLEGELFFVPQFTGYLKGKMLFRGFERDIEVRKK